jgi:hypothetical protein
MSPPTRLRDEHGAGPAARAGAVIRGVAVPPSLGPRADARITAALNRGATDRRLIGLLRLLVPAAALLLIAVTGVSAVAGLEWLRASRPTPPLAAAPAPSLPPRPTPPRAAEVPRAVVRLGALPQRRRPEAAFTRAQLAIDPRAPGHRPQVPAEFWRAHMGEQFAWKVKICVSASGQVRNVTLLNHLHPALDPEIARAIGQWRYHPASRAGRTVPSCWNLVYHLAVEPGEQAR